MTIVWNEELYISFVSEWIFWHKLLTSFGQCRSRVLPTAFGHAGLQGEVSFCDAIFLFLFFFLFLRPFWLMVWQDTGYWLISSLLGYSFQAANPGCILEDFVRWHSPPDWSENETTSDLDDTSDSGDLSSVKGQLSRRMQKEGIKYFLYMLSVKNICTDQSFSDLSRGQGSLFSLITIKIYQYWCRYNLRWTECKFQPAEFRKFFFPCRMQEIYGVNFGKHQNQYLLSDNLLFMMRT